MEKIPPVFQLLINDANDPNSTENDRNYSMDTLRNEKEDSVNNLKVTNNKNIDEKQKDDNLQALNSNDSVINKTEEEKALIELLMSTNFPLKDVNHVIGTISSCSKNMVEFEKLIKIPSKYKWEYCDVIPLLTLLGVNNCQPFLHW